MRNLARFTAILIAISLPLGAQALNKKLGPKSYQDARHCLDLPTREQIIKCAEKYM
jgi:hypothetical protein